MIKHLLLASFWIGFENILTTLKASTKLHHFYVNRYWLLKIAKRADGSTQGSIESDWTMGFLKLNKI